MTTKLYVASLPLDPSTDDLTAYFGRCGEVLSVRLVADRETGRARSAAIVTMGAHGDARRAVTELDGMVYERKVLAVSIVREQPFGDDDRSAKKGTPRRDLKARITQQFRQLENLTYELDCAGTPLVLRMFFPLEQGPTGQWRLEARASHADDAAVVHASATTRRQALLNVAARCRSDDPLHPFPNVDWEAVEQALGDVRAL